MPRASAPILLILATLACNFPTTQVVVATIPVITSPEATPLGASLPAPTLPPTRDPNLPIVSPTPDNAHNLPTLRGDFIEYQVQPYDFLSSIAERFGVTLEELIAANDLADPNQLEVGQILRIPPQSAASLGPACGTRRLPMPARRRAAATSDTDRPAESRRRSCRRRTHDGRTHR